MFLKGSHPLLLSVLMVVLWECLIAEAQFLRRPKDGDSCRSYRFAGPANPNLYNWFRFQSGVGLPCQEGTVVSSGGQCVDPWSLQADRCQNTESFTQDRINRICQQQPTAIFADPYNCNRYYDCSKGYQFRHVQCPSDLLTTTYVSTQTLLAFDDVDKVCKPITDVMCGRRPVKYSREQVEAICRANPARVFADTDNCNSFYNCSRFNDPAVSVLPPFAGECPYLQLFDTETKTCQDYYRVKCHLRTEIKNPCELRQFQCRTSHCRPCVIDNPDCTGQPDGNQPLDLQVFTPRYVRCQQGRTLGVEWCQAAVGRSGYPEARLFHPGTKRCELITTIPRSLGGTGA
ncbi:uncharacterized protein LOC143284876 [Babylonia areolata]|uniref:uncharacterized protein LOC143284876 n=1 Tax=Babylonia areolata TaxID=304850 RepID=UPI003FD2CE99